MNQNEIDIFSAGFTAGFKLNEKPDFSICKVIHGVGGPNNFIPFTGNLSTGPVNRNKPQATDNFFPIFLNLKFLPELN